MKIVAENTDNTKILKINLIVNVLDIVEAYLKNVPLHK